MLFGSTVSNIAGNAAWFSFMIWAYQSTENPISISIMMIANILPGAIVGAFVAPFLDRINPYLLLILTNLFFVISSMIVLYVIFIHHISYEIILLILVFESMVEVAQSLVFSKIITTLNIDFIPKANSLLGFTSSISDILGPAIGGIVYYREGLFYIAAIDLSGSFVFFAISLLFLRAKVEKDSKSPSSSIIPRRLSLLERLKLFTGNNAYIKLITLFLFLNIFFSLMAPLIIPVISAKSSVEGSTVGFLLSLGGAAGVAGGILSYKLLTVSNTIKSIYYGCIATIVLGPLLLSLADTLVLIMVAVFFSSFFYPLILAANQTLWQKITPYSVQAQIFSIRDLAGSIGIPIGLVISPLAVNSLDSVVFVGEYTAIETFIASVSVLSLIFVTIYYIKILKHIKN